ncbi:hypothetical protein BABINDRAFT_161426 [Babjeviella inositovora NRRL Y-12698]|uniref:Dihydroorotate dehydrogenase (quinone), mitochondrial n=1 Tax=Babjeviella inositovora NRRL Y-12698 TaxID=984486 RepID=A0A1E3QQE8_9ASCO|nr:uncharacterized protein BABINDRAFT_161426 [Babjeviella inositovora NRRL Y-12698]ODQ79714.1 hypothetical protein BABINDRAFT_161426 [Babjeviella inositovora NRRL Y-12698]
MLLNNTVKKAANTVFKRSVATRPVLKSSIFPKALLVTGGLLGLSLTSYYLLNARSAVHEYVFCPLIRAFTDAEDGHKWGVALMKYGLVPKLFDDQDDAVLATCVFGNRVLSNPVGLAAGLDKDAEAIDALFDFGFGYVEVGSITPEAQPGNPQPRFFRLPKDDAVINRYGFNSTGHWEVATRLRLRLEKLVQRYVASETNAFRENRMLGINLGKNKHGEEVNDYVLGVRRLGQFADVLVINVSSPNTPGLRDLQSESKLTNLLKTVVAERDILKVNRLGQKPPVLVKVAPDLSEVEIASIAQSAKDAKIDGIIISNTTIQRPVDQLRTKDLELVNQMGGLSGKPLKPLSLQALRTLRKYTKESDLTIIGCGGISSGKDAIEFAKAGANFVQLYTSFAYRGPGLVAKIKDEITAELKKEGKTWNEIVGEDDK